MIVVVGAGLAGLSAAYHLQEREEVVVFDKESSPGGLCRSVETDGFTFDLTGHLLHLRRPEIKALVENLIPADQFMRIDRRSFIYSQSTFTPYPFQVNTHGLPGRVVSECVAGFGEALLSGAINAEEIPDLSFRQWVLRTFGEGIAKHFMLPYNEKLWLSDLEDVTCEWVSWSIPRPSLKEVVDGALGISHKAFGYNPSFLYPKKGGIRILPEALAARVDKIVYQSEVVRVDATHNCVTLRSGEVVSYDQLISTVPLPTLMGMTHGLPMDLVAAARNLRRVAVMNINLGIDRVVHPDKHWVYFPEKEFVFYRAGFPASFTPTAAPPGCSSIYLEIAVRPGEQWDEETMMAQAREGLLRAGILRPEDKILTSVVFSIDPAYVIYDRYRRDLVPRLRRALSTRGIHSIGRYGAWYYNSMEDSMAEGRGLALELLDPEMALTRSEEAG